MLSSDARLLFGRPEVPVVGALAPDKGGSEAGTSALAPETGAETAAENELSV